MYIDVCFKTKLLEVNYKGLWIDSKNTVLQGTIIKRGVKGQQRGGIIRRASVVDVLPFSINNKKRGG